MTIDAVSWSLAYTEFHTEKQFLASVREEAELQGWDVMHQLRSRGTDAGWPDLFMVRGDRIVVAELKRPGNQPSDYQWYWMYRLLEAGMDVRLWYPADVPEIIEVLA